MADSGSFRTGGALQPWQRESILAAASFLRERFGGNPPTDARARAVHESLLEVLDPARRAVRLQKELSAATRKTPPPSLAERRAAERRQRERRKANLGPPSGTSERRQRERRSGRDRRGKR
jgi:hypothetical protein